MFLVKPGVKLVGLQPEMMVALAVVWSTFSSYGIDCVITSGTEGHHGSKSLHYVGYALDFRTRELSHNSQVKLSSNIQSQLSSEYDVILEATHLHVEFQPKGA